MAASGLLDLLQDDSVQVITGKFIYDGEKEYWMDLNINNKHFKKCIIIGGDFASGGFKDCSFEETIFIDTQIVAVNFNKCRFVSCIFSTNQLDVSMKNCEIVYLNNSTFTDKEFFFKKPIEEYFPKR